MKTTQVEVVQYRDHVIVNTGRGEWSVFERDCQACKGEGHDQNLDVCSSCNGDGFNFEVFTARTAGECAAAIDEVMDDLESVDVSFSRNNNEDWKDEE